MLLLFEFEVVVDDVGRGLGDDYGGHGTVEGGAGGGGGGVRDSAEGNRDAAKTESGAGVTADDGRSAAGTKTVGKKKTVAVVSREWADAVSRQAMMRTDRVGCMYM